MQCIGRQDKWEDGLNIVLRAFISIHVALTSAKLQSV